MITRGVQRYFHLLNQSTLTEFKLTSARRVDVCAINKGGRFTIVEVKSSVADFRADNKWHEYLEFCDFFYFAVGPEFPKDRIPEDCGLIVADGFDAVEIRTSLESPMNATRRKAQTLRFARTAAARLYDTSVS